MMLFSWNNLQNKKASIKEALYFLIDEIESKAKLYTNLI